MDCEQLVRSFFTRPVDIGFAMLILIVRVPLHLRMVLTGPDDMRIGPSHRVAHSHSSGTVGSE
jgi:hypothetical protein